MIGRKMCKNAHFSAGVLIYSVLTSPPPCQQDPGPDPAPSHGRCSSPSPPDPAADPASPCTAGTHRGRQEGVNSAVNPHAASVVK